jgi:hypothetical protein
MLLHIIVINSLSFTLNICFLELTCKSNSSSQQTPPSLHFVSFFFFWMNELIFCNKKFSLQTTSTNNLKHLTLYKYHTLSHPSPTIYLTITDFHFTQQTTPTSYYSNKTQNITTPISPYQFPNYNISLISPVLLSFPFPKIRALTSHLIFCPTWDDCHV